MKLGYLIKKGLFHAFNKTIIINEAHLNRMFHSIPGWLDKGHLWSFEYAIKNLPNQNPILEIGTFFGLSTNTILYYLKKHNKTNLLITTDWYRADIPQDEKICNVVNVQDYQTYIKDSFVRNVRFFNPQAQICSSDLSTNDFFAAWNTNEITNLFGGTFQPNNQISFAYVDGNHQYDYVKQDFINIDKILCKDGFILFDDSADYTNWGSKLVAREVAKLSNYKVIRKNPHYLFQKLN